MLTYARLTTGVSVLFLLLSWAAPKASAYRGETTLNFGSQLSGYTATFKDWWDVDSGYDCVWWEWDPEYGEYCVSWTYWESWVSVIGRLYTPSGGVYANGYNKGWSVAGLDLIPFTPSENGTWTHVGNHYVETDWWRDDGYGWYFTGTEVNFFGQTAQQANVQVDPCAPVPSSESSASEGFFGVPATQVGFRQTLAGGNFGGRQVTEQDVLPSNPDNDTCWWPGSMFSRQLTLSGGSWGVASNNTWGLDYLGWSDASQHNYPITYYRNNGRAPCQTTVPQRMVISCSNGSTQAYSTSNLELGFTNSTVWSRRLGVFDEKPYP